MNDKGNEIEKFFAKYKLVEYKAKEVIIDMADEPSGVYFIKEGFIKMNAILANGNELTLNIFKPGSFFPMFWALGEVPNNYIFETMTEVSVYKAPRKEVMDFLNNNSAVALGLIKRILSGVDGLLTNYNHMLVGNADTRVASALLIAAKRFGEVDTSGKTLIKLKLTHQDIANLAGISRERASIVIGELVKGGIIEQIDRRFVILDMDKLYEKTTFDGELLTSSTVL